MKNQIPVSTWNLTTGNRILWKRGEIAPKEQLLPYLYLQESNYIFICEMWFFDLFFLNFANLICRDTDISKYFRESLGLLDNESRLYLQRNVFFLCVYRMEVCSSRFDWSVMLHGEPRDNSQCSQNTFRIQSTLVISTSLISNYLISKWNSSLYRSEILITKTRLFKYIENFTSKNWKFSDKKLWYFSYICLKHRL